MFEPSNLIPNLNEIMEEYAEIKKEVIQEAQSEAVQEEERPETRTETEKPTEETRKRNREAEEAETEHRKEKVSDFVSELAYFAWKDKLQYKDFIGERGFSKLISPFQEIIEKRGWHLFCEHKAPRFVDVIKEFYSNMVGLKEKTCFVRGQWISFNGEKIDETFNLKERKNGSKFKRLVKKLEYQKIVDLMTDGKGKWSATRKNPHQSIARGSLTKEAKVWFYFIFSVLLPSKHLNIVREKEAILLYAILKGYKFSVGKIIENSILSYCRSNYRGLVPHPALITKLCIMGGVEEDWEEEETCPKSSPLTLTRITKGLKNCNAPKIP